jgi:hypothetical protein
MSVFREYGHRLYSIFHHEPMAYHMVQDYEKKR